MDDMNTTNDRIDMQTNSEQKDFFNYRYFTEFIDSLVETNDTEEALAAVDKVYPMLKLEGREELVEDAREELLDLITE